MLPEINERIEFLSHTPIFGELCHDEISDIADRLIERKIAQDEILFKQNDVADNFYIIVSGHIRVWYTRGSKRVDIGLFENGDHLGEYGLLFRHPRTASAMATEETTLLYLDEEDFNWLVRTCPKVKLHLEAIKHTHRRAMRLRFDWLSEGEVIYLISRRHVFLLARDIIAPFLIALVLFALFLMSKQIESNIINTILVYLTGGLLLVFPIPLGIWKFADWRNDYFIVTNQRVVWLEQVLLKSDSRREAPLSAIQSVKVDTNFWGRTFNFGNVTVRTYTGRVEMTNVDNPSQMNELIERLIKRVRRKNQQAKLDEIARTIRQRLNYDTEKDKERTQNQTNNSQTSLDKNSRRPGPFSTREVDGDIITYHKHWFVLFKKLIWPTIIVPTILIISILLLVKNKVPAEQVFITGLILVGFCAVWWIYVYTDWDNDIYRLTKDKIIDREKKPLGKESVQSAPLVNVLSVEHERPTLLNIILDIGTVKINVGDITLLFYDVHNPARVHQDIFDYQETLEYEGKKREAERENNRMATWLEIYHEQTGGSHSSDHEPDFF